MTAGTAATRPMAVVMSASAMPGPTTTSGRAHAADVAERLHDAETVPKRPMNGAAEPVVARKDEGLRRVTIGEQVEGALDALESPRSEGPAHPAASFAFAFCSLDSST